MAHEGILHILCIIFNQFALPFRARAAIYLNIRHPLREILNKQDVSIKIEEFLYYLSPRALHLDGILDWVCPKGAYQRQFYNPRVGDRNERF